MWMPTRGVPGGSEAWAASALVMGLGRRKGELLEGAPPAETGATALEPLFARSVAESTESLLGWWLRKRRRFLEPLPPAPLLLLGMGDVLALLIPGPSEGGKVWGLGGRPSSRLLVKAVAWPWWVGWLCMLPDGSEELDAEPTRARASASICSLSLSTLVLLLRLLARVASNARGRSQPSSAVLLCRQAGGAQEH